MTHTWIAEIAGSSGALKGLAVASTSSSKSAEKIQCCQCDLSLYFAVLCAGGTQGLTHLITSVESLLQG